MLDPIRRIFRLSTGRSRIDADIGDELDFHRLLAIDELIAQGVDPAEAARQIEIRSGDRPRIERTLKAIGRSGDDSARRGEVMDRWLTEFRRAFRGLRRDPWISLAAIALTALGLGANVAVFSIVNAAFIQRLPYADADRIVTVMETQAGGRMRVASQNLLDWQREANDLTHLSAYRDLELTVTVGERPLGVRAAAVSASFATAMGVAPIAGRWFSAAEARVGGAPAVVLSERYWRSHFGAASAVIGSSLRVDGAPVTVVGILPAALDFPVGAKLWVPAEPSIENPNRTGHNWGVVGRLKPGVTTEQATRSLTVLTRRLVAAETPSPYLADGASLTPLRTTLLGESAQVLRLLQAAVAILLLIASLNLMTLFLARAAKRRGEVAMTMTLGAGRADLARRFVAESLVITAIGAAVGLGLWYVGRGALAAGLGQFLPFVHSLPIDGVLIGAALIAVLVVGFGAGFVPALWVARAVERGTARRETTRVLGPGRLMQVLLGAEVAATFVLLVGAGLLFKSLTKMLDQPLGYSVDQRAYVEVTVPTGQGSEYLAPERHVGFFDELLRQLGSLPGVSAISVTTALPIKDYSPNGSARIQGEISDAGGPAASSDFRVVAPGFFGTLDIPIVAGRDFSPADGAASPYVAVVSEAFGRVHLQGSDPIGRLVRFPGMDTHGEDRWATVVGVAADVRQDGPGAVPQPAIYYSFRQRPEIYRTMTVVARVAGPPQAFLSAAEVVLRSLEPGVPFVGAPVGQALSGLVEGPRARTVVLGSFAAAALVLAGLGLFGVVGFIVLARTRELGLRIALGASGRSVAAAATGHALAPVLGGLAAGLALALILTRLARSFLFELSPTDPITFAAAGAAIALVAATACLPPVRRALQIDPATALRTD